MRKKIKFIITSVLIVISIRQLFAQEKSAYVSGGRNIEAHKYFRPEGYPEYPDITKFIGTLKGDWYEMGKQFGERAGESTRYVSDIWWKEMCELWGKKESLKALVLVR